MSTKRLSPILEKKHGPVTFALFLRTARESLGLTQTEMAQKLGIAKGTLCDVEKGRQLVSVTWAKKIAAGSEKYYCHCFRKRWRREINRGC